MELNLKVWNNIDRLREQLQNISRVLASYCAINLFYTVAKKNYFLAVINLLGLMVGVITILSKAKWDKNLSYKDGIKN